MTFKILHKTLLLSTVMLGCGVQAEQLQYEFIARDTSNETQLCVLAAGNQAAALRRNIRLEPGNLQSLKVQKIASTVFCNDKPIGEFTQQYGALDTLRMLDRAAYTRLMQSKKQITVQEVTANDTGKRFVTLLVGGK